MKRVLLSTLVATALLGSEVDDLLDGFDDDKETKVKKVASKSPLEGKFTQSATYATNTSSPHDNLNSFKSSLFLEYNKKFDNGFKLKLNGVGFYDFIYSNKGSEKFTKEELDSLRSEVELYDFFVEGSLSDKLDIKLGRQVVVWGRSDSIRITDILNPLDNRRPAMVDIEDLRLPVGMLKFDYYLDDNWRVTPIVIGEQRFTKNPPFGSQFYPLPTKQPTQKEPTNTTYALNIGGEFSGYDVDFYYANIYA